MLLTRKDTIVTSRTNLFLKVDIIDELPQATSFPSVFKPAPKKKKVVLHL